MTNLLSRIRDWLTGPRPRHHLFIIRYDGRVLMKMNFEMLMYMNRFYGRHEFMVDLSSDGKIIVNDNLAWPKLAFGND